MALERKRCWASSAVVAPRWIAGWGKIILALSTLRDCSLASSMFIEKASCAANLAMIIGRPILLVQAPFTIQSSELDPDPYFVIARNA